MKLHLPTRLRAAVLACITAVAALSSTVGTGALTTGVVAYTLAASQTEAAEATINTNNAALNTYTAEDTLTFDLNGATAGGSSYLINGNPTIAAAAVINNLILNNGYSNAIYTFTNAISGSGQFSFSGQPGNQTYTFSGDMSNYSGNMIMSDHVTLNFNGNTSGTGVITTTTKATTGSIPTLADTETGAVTTNLKLNVNGATMLNSAITAGTLNVSGTSSFAGTVAVNNATLAANTALTLSNAASLAVTGTLSMDLSGMTTEAAPVINGTGRVVSAGALTLSNYASLEAGSYKLIATTSEAADALAALFTSSAKYTVSNIDGVVTLTVADSSDLVWNGGNGTWDSSTENWLSGETAAPFAPNDNVRFATAGAQVTINGDKLTKAVQIDADTEWKGTATVNTQTLAGTGTLSLDSGVTLAVAESATGVTINGSGTYAMPAGSKTLGVTLAQTWSGTVSLNHASNTVLSVTNLNLNDYGNAGSTVELTSVSGYFVGNTMTINPNLVLTNSPDGSQAGLAITNGSSGKTYTFAGSISGTGNFAHGFGGSGQTYIFEGDLSQWTGNFTQTAGPLTVTFNGTARQPGANFNFNGGNATIAGDGLVTFKNMTMGGSAVTVNTDVKVDGTLTLGTGNSSVGKSLTIAEGKSLTATTMTNAWGTVLNLGAGSALTVTGRATIAPGTAQRIWSGAGADSSTITFGGLSTSNGANTLFRGLSLHIGASGITQDSRAGRLVLDNAALVADASFTATSANQTSGLIELVNTATVATGEHNVTIGSKVTGTGSLNKTGEGKLTLSGTSDFSGGLTVTEGTVEAAAVSSLGAGAVTVEADGTLELKLGNVLAEGQTVTNAGTVVLHDTLTLGTIANNGTLVIAADFAGLESAGIVNIEGGAGENGFRQGGTATIFSAPGAITGSLDASFQGSTVTIAENGTVTLADDFSTYHVNSALLDTETFSAMQAGAAAHDKTIAAIDFAVENQTLTVDAAGLATSMLQGEHAGTVTLAMGDGQTLTVDADTAAAISLADSTAATFAMSKDADIASLTLGNGTTVNVTGTGTLNIAATAQRSVNGKSTTYNLGENTVINDNSYIKLTNATLTFQGGGVYNLKGICSASEGSHAGNVTIGAGTTLHIMGTAVSVEGNTGSFMMSNWGATSTYNVSGALISEAGISGRDGTGIINVLDGGMLQLNAGFVTSTERDNHATIKVKNGGLLKVASTATAYNNQIAVELENGSTMESFAADGAAVIAQNLKLVGTAEAPATAAIKVAAETSLTLGGVISGDNGGLNKTGDGSLVLSGANTYAGGTTVSAGALSVTSSSGLGTGAVTVAGGALTLAAEEAISMGVLSMTSGSIVLAGAEKLAINGAVTLSGGTLDFTNVAVAEAVGNTVLGSVTGDVSVSNVTLAGLASSLTSQFDVSVTKDGNNLVLSVASKSAPLYWNGGSGTWDSTATNTVWGAEGDDTSTGKPYATGALVTISGTEGGMITIGSPVAAGSVTIAHSGYTLANESQTDTLTITGDFTVNEDVSTTLLNFIPDVGGNIVVKSGATLDMSGIDISQNLLVTVGSKATGDGTVVLKGNSGTDLRESVELNTNVTVDGGLWLNGRDTNATVTVTEGHTLTLTGELSISRSAKVSVEGGTLDAQGGIAVGHPEGNYPTTLSMSSGEIKTTGIKLQSNNTNTIDMTGGTLTITGETAFTGTNDRTTLNVGAATITNGETDMAFNHGSTLTGTTISAQNDKTITVGGESMTTNVVTGITTEGTVVLAGTTAVAADATITDNGTLTIADLSAAAANVTLAGTGATTITTGTADTLTAGKDATLGNVSVKNVTGTGTLTQTAGTTLTVADGGTLSGSVTTGNITAEGSLSKTGTDTVTTGDITGASTALTVSGGTLAAGAVTVASAEVATGAALTSSGKLSSAGALTLNGAANAASADIASLILNAGGSLTCTNDLKLGALTLNSAITSAGVTAASLSSETLDVSVSADVLGALAMGSGDSLTIVGLTSQYGNGLTLNGSTDASFDEFGYKYTIASTADGIVISKADAGVVWTGGADDEWGKEGSWQGGGVPTGDDVSASFTGKGDGTVKVSSDGVTIGQIIVTSHDAAAGEKSEYTFTNGDLTIAEDLKVLDGHVIIGTTVAATDVNIIPSAAEGSVSSVTVNGDGALSVSGTLAVEAATEEGIGSLTIQEGGFAGIHTLASSGADVALGGTLAVEEGVIKKLTDESGTKGNLVVGSMVAPTSLTPVVPDEVIILEDSEIDTLLVTGTGNLTTKGALTAETSTDVAGTLTAEKDLTTGALTVTSAGNVTVGSAAAPATLDVTTLANEGTVTVYNTMKAETSVENKSTGTLDIKGELQAADATVENSKTLAVGGTLTADTLTTNSGATTEAKGGATLGTALTNHGTTTITGDLASADTTAPIVITNDATGTGEKLVVTGNVSGTSLTTAEGATTELTGADKTVKLTEKLTNKGTTTITGALTSADATATDPGSLVIENTGVLSTGNLTADSLSGNGATTVTGNATLSKLDLGTTGSLTASGTAKVDSVLSTGGSVTADTLDLGGLTAAATIANVKADKITLSGFNMLTVTDSIANENGTGAAKVMLTLDDATMSTLSVGDEKVVVATDGSVSGQGITLGNLAAVNNALKAYGIKGSMVTTAAGELVMQVQDNSFVSQIATSENGIAGAEMVDAASAAGLATAGTALGDVYAALDACRTTGDAATGDRLAAAVTGSSIAAMGSALSGDVERQLRAIRNRTTTMGVNQSVINEDMPYVNAWVNAEGDYRKVAADGTMAGYKMMSWGGTVGMDVDFTPSFTCGLAATAMYGDFDADGTDHATGDIDTYYVSAFARYAKHRWTHTFVATVGMADTSLERTVLGHTVKGDSDGMMFGGMYEVGYVFALDKDATTCLQPVFNVSYTHASLSGYDEDGANIALTAGDTEFNKLTVGAGLRLQSIIGENIYNRSSIFEGRAMLKFDAGDRQGETEVAFAGSGLPSHTVKSSETGALGAEFGVGLTVPVGAEGGNIFVDASAEIRAEYTNVNATVGYRVNF